MLGAVSGDLDLNRRLAMQFAYFYDFLTPCSHPKLLRGVILIKAAHFPEEIDVTGMLASPKVVSQGEYADRRKCLRAEGQRKSQRAAASKAAQEAENAPRAARLRAHSEA